MCGCPCIFRDILSLVTNCLFSVPFYFFIKLRFVKISQLYQLVCCQLAGFGYFAVRVSVPESLVRSVLYLSASAHIFSLNSLNLRHRSSV